jgi:hypothetical protein
MHYSSARPTGAANADQGCGTVCPLGSMATARRGQVNRETCPCRAMGMASMIGGWSRGSWAWFSVGDKWFCELQVGAQSSIRDRPLWTVTGRYSTDAPFTRTQVNRCCPQPCRRSRPRSLTWSHATFFVRPPFRQQQRRGEGGWGSGGRDLGVLLVPSPREPHADVKLPSHSPRAKW